MGTTPEGLTGWKALRENKKKTVFEPILKTKNSASISQYFTCSKDKNPDLLYLI